MIGREIHLYDYSLNECLFKYKASAFLEKIANLFFLDNDALLVLQTGESSFILISISSQIELYKQKTQKIESIADTLPINPILTEIEAAGFGVNKDGEFLQQEHAETEKNKEESENEIDEITGFKEMRLDTNIKSIWHSRNNTDMGYIAVISEKSRFTIYYA